MANHNNPRPTPSLPHGISLTQLLAEANSLGLHDLADYLAKHVPQLPPSPTSCNSSPAVRTAQPFHYTLR